VRSRPDRETVRDPECGDASACLKLRIPVIRRDRGGIHQFLYPIARSYSGQFEGFTAPDVLIRGQRK
jgi:hypothetical protein